MENKSITDEKLKEIIEPIFGELDGFENKVTERLTENSNNIVTVKHPKLLKFIEESNSTQSILLFGYQMGSITKSQCINNRHYLFLQDVIDATGDFYYTFFEIKISNSIIKENVKEYKSVIKKLKEIRDLDWFTIKLYEKELEKIISSLELQVEPVTLTKCSLLKSLTQTISMLMQRYFNSSSNVIISDIYQAILPEIPITAENVKDHLRDKGMKE